MVGINGALTASIIIPVPLLAYATYKLGRLIHERYRVVQEQYEYVTTHAQETFSGVRVVRAYAREDAEANRFETLSKNYYRTNMGLARVNGLMMPSMTVLFNITYLVVIGFGGALVMQQDMTVGELTQFFIYLNQLLWPIAAIGWVTGMIQRGAASMGRLGKIIDATSDIADGASTDHAITALEASIHLDHVTLRYGSITVLHDITVNVPAGTSLGIIGHVGSGKSTIASLLPRMVDASEGTLRVGGHDVRTIPLDVLRGAIAMVPQEAFLFSETIRNNVRFGRPNASDADVEHAATIAQLSTDLANLPDGYETMVGERGVTLSGGQKQRTALARAILSDPKILILDDALSAVDTDTEERILRGLRDVMRQRTSIMIAHRISTVQHCDQIIVLRDGRIVEQGSHAELLAMNGIYADMYERQLLLEELA
jgi:ATP-binding cassette subfamily B protein